MFKLVLEKAEEPEIKLPTSTESSKKQESSRKTSISALLTMPKPLTVWITINCLDVLLFLFDTSLLFHIQFYLLFLDLHTDFSGDRSCGLVFPSLSEFPQFVVIHTVKGFGIVNKAEVDVFLELSCFFDDSVDVGNLISGSSAFSKSSLKMWMFMDLVKL